MAAHGDAAKIGRMAALPERSLRQDRKTRNRYRQGGPLDLAASAAFFSASPSRSHARRRNSRTPPTTDSTAPT